MKFSYFLFLIISFLFSCQSEPIKNQKKYPTEIHQVLHSFQAELKNFYIKNDFCKSNETIGVGNEKFLLKKKIEQVIEENYPALYRARYGMVTYTLIPYSIAQKAGLIQQEILDELGFYSFNGVLVE